MEKADEINLDRLSSWQKYHDGLKELENDDYLELPKIPNGCVHNAHMFYIKVKNLYERTKLIDYLKENDINVAFHYVPLHSAPAGLKFGRFNGIDGFTTKESERLLRLPMYYDIKDKEIDIVIKAINEFFGKQ